MLSSSMARLRRRRMNQRTPGTNTRSIVAQMASTPTRTASQSGIVTVDVIALSSGSDARSP